MERDNNIVTVVYVMLQIAPDVLRNISSAIAQSQAICKVVATVLVLILYLAAIGNLVSITNISCMYVIV